MSLSVCGQSVLACAHEELQQKGNQRELRVVIPSRQVSNEGGKGVRERERKRKRGKDIGGDKTDENLERRRGLTGGAPAGAIGASDLGDCKAS